MVFEQIKKQQRVIPAFILIENAMPINVSYRECTDNEGLVVETQDL